MKTSIIDTESQHQEIALLLPWFVNNSLEGEELSRVENHIRHCFICRRELVDLRKLATAFGQKSELDIAAETSFARLGGKLVKPTIIPTQHKTPRGRGISRYTSNRSVRFALAASLVLAALLPLALPKMSNYGDDSFATLSAARPTAMQTGELRVVFAQSLSASDIAALLQQLHGQQVGEANSVGALNIRLNSDGGSPDVEQAIAMLRSRPDVLLAEPVLQP
jgi:hypothetical protein